MSPLRATPSLLAVCLLAAAPVVAVRAQDTASVRAAGRGVVMDFQDADLRAVIAALAEAGNLNVAFGDLPARHVTLRLRQPVARADVLPLLRSLARSNGLRVVEEAGLVRVEAATDDSVAAGRGAAGGRAQPGDLRLFVYRLKHVRAARLAATLQAIYGTRGPGAPAASIGARSLSDQLRRTQIAPLDVDTLRPPSQPMVVVAPPVMAAATASGGLPGMLQGEMQIVPDETTNSLLVRALPADYEIVRQAIEAMDLRPLQVLIEVVIAEVRHTRQLDVGVSASVSRQSADAATVTSGQLQTSATNDFIVRILRGGNVNVDLAISALAQRGDVRILSRPVVLAQNNEPARILVGSQRPFVQVFRSLPTEAAVRDQVVQYRDVGTSLAILPTINPDGYMSLEVQQEVSSATAETQFGAPVISTREASTHMFVRDGQTAVLGGLVDRERDVTRSGIPILSALPGIGVLFGTTNHTDTSSELFLFLTPHLVLSDDDVDRVRDEIERRPAIQEPLKLAPPVVAPRKP